LKLLPKAYNDVERFSKGTKYISFVLNIFK
jgi:hypothetical protein